MENIWISNDQTHFHSPCISLHSHKEYIKIPSFSTFGKIELVDDFNVLLSHYSEYMMACISFILYSLFAVEINCIFIYFSYKKFRNISLQSYGIYSFFSRWIIFLLSLLCRIALNLFYSSSVDLQCCVNFFCTSKWFNYTY